MRILLTNDDGIDAPGLSLLEEIASELGNEIWTVAPATDQSGIGHALTLSHPLRISERGERRFAVTGTPADCVIVGVRALMDEPPDLVLSGINQGQNIADDVVYSGTIGGAMEAAMMDIRSIALSQAYARTSDGRVNVPWQNSREVLPALIRNLVSVDLPAPTFLNVNVPATHVVRGVRTCFQGRVDHSLETEAREDGRGKPYHWLRFARGRPEGQAGSDIAALQDGFVSVCPIQTDLTAHRQIELVDRVVNGANA